MIVENASFRFWFLGHSQVSFYVGNCKNVFLWKVYSISSDFAWSFSNIKYFTKGNFTFSGIFWKLILQTCLIYFRNTTGSYTFQPWAWYLIVSTFRLMDFLFHKTFVVSTKFGTNSSKNVFLSFVGFWGVFEAISKKMQIYLQRCLLDTGISQYWVLLNLFMLGSSLKIVQKNALRVLKRETLSFCNILVIWRKFCVNNNANFASKNVLRTYFYHIRLFEAFISKLSEIGKKFDISTFCSQFWAIFQPSQQIFSQERTGLWVQSLLNVWQHSDSKTIQKVHISGIKTMLNFFDFSTHLESFWSVFKAERSNVLFKCTA